MVFTSTHIKGSGRGHKIGFPTINLVVPSDFELDVGIYAVWVAITGSTYKGALHYGSIPTFNEKDTSLEIHLLDITDHTVPDTHGVDIKVDIVEKLRDIKFFDTAEDLALQIDRDVNRVRSILAL